MFEATMSNATIMKRVIDSIKDLVSQVNIEANESGLSLQAMDSAHISLVNLMLNVNGFSSYRCDKPVFLGISLIELSKIFKMASADDQVTLKTEHENNFLTILFVNSKTFKEAEFQLNLLQLESESLGIPDTEYPTTVTLGSSEFSKLIKELNTVAEVIQLAVSDDKQMVLSYKGKAGKGKITLKNVIGGNENESVVIKCEEAVDALFGLSYLNNFAKGSILSDTVIVNISNQFPMMIQYNIEDFGFLKLYLAPKMDEEN